MSIVASEANRLRSISAERSSSANDDRLSRVPKMARTTCEREESASEDVPRDETVRRTGEKKKEAKRKMKVAVKSKSSKREEVEEEEEEAVNEQSSEEFDSTYYERGSSPEIGRVEPSFECRSSYEVLGLRSAQPSSRPPILEMTRSAREGLRWAANDCAASAAALRRARPERTLAAGFFDRLELLRRVALAEIAKAPSMVEAMAAVGVAFDREMLLISAEEVYSREGARGKVLKCDPGNYEELAADLGAGMRKARGVPRAGASQGWRRGTQSTLSKPKKPYASPFRGAGTGLLFEARCPRAASAPSARAASWRWRRGLDEREVEGVAQDGGTPPASAVAEERGASEVVRSGTSPERGAGTGAGRGDKEGDAGFTREWRFCARVSGGGVPDVPHPQ